MTTTVTEKKIVKNTFGDGHVTYQVKFITKSYLLGMHFNTEEYLFPPLFPDKAAADEFCEYCLDVPSLYTEGRGSMVFKLNCKIFNDKITCLNEAIDAINHLDSDRFNESGYALYLYYIIPVEKKGDWDSEYENYQNRLFGTNHKNIMYVFYQGNPRSGYSFGTRNMYSTLKKLECSRLVDQTLRSYTDRLKAKQDKRHQEHLHNLVVGSEEISAGEFSSDEILAQKKAEIQKQVLNSEIDKLAEDRNDILMQEIKRIDDYRGYLVSMLKH